jgi:hypothetical protein
MAHRDRLADLPRRTGLSHSDEDEEEPGRGRITVSQHSAAWRPPCTSKSRGRSRVPPSPFQAGSWFPVTSRNSCAGPVGALPWAARKSVSWPELRQIPTPGRSWRRPSRESLQVSGGGGCEIRTREGLHPTRFPTLLTSVHAGLRPYVTSHDALRAHAGGRSWTGANETQTEPRPRGRYWRASGSQRGGRQRGWSRNLRPPMGSTFSRFRVLRTTIHRRSRAFLTRYSGRPASARERLRTGVNETKTETRPGASPGHARPRTRGGW